MSDHENSLLRHLEPAKLIWTDSGEPYSVKFGDHYFSSSSGIEESRYIFLLRNNLPERWSSYTGKTFTVAETGFGTGLNFLVTLAAWKQHAPADANLHYLSVEAAPLTRTDLERALQRWTELNELAARLLENYPPSQAGNHRMLFEDGRVTLDLCLGDASEMIENHWLNDSTEATVDAWYLDGFTPSRNSSLWTPTLLEKVAALSGTGTTCATFTAAAAVRRTLESLGFDITKVQGFGAKRDMLCGTFSGRRRQAKTNLRPWHSGAATHSRRSAIVLGAGLAGCSTAHALARRGWQVTVLEAEPGIAAAASGNTQGVLYTRLSNQHSAVAEFALYSYLFAVQGYRRMLDTGRLKDGEDASLCGVLHTRHKVNSRLLSNLRDFPGLAHWLEPDQASATSSLTDCPPGLYFPQAGWVSPPALCNSLLSHPNIQLKTGVGPIHMKRRDRSWNAIVRDGICMESSEVAILCTGSAVVNQSECSWLPTRAIRGQVSSLPASVASRNLSTVICHEGYLCPEQNNMHGIGATYDLNDTNPYPDSAGHQHNITTLRAALPQLFTDQDIPDPDKLDGRVGFRCASPDYLPLVGAAPDLDQIVADYGGLRSDAKAKIYDPGTYHPGLFINTGHGSRGLTSTPLSAELLASVVEGQFAPLPTNLVRALSPTRFIVRDLIRNKR